MQYVLKKVILFIFPIMKWSAITGICILILLYFIKHESRNFNISGLKAVAKFDLLTLVIYLILYKIKWIDKWGNSNSE